MTLCEENCNFIEYDYTNKKAKCSCEIKISLPLIDEIKFDTGILKNSFIDINSIANFKIMKCYKSILDKKELKNNYGFFIIFFIILLFIISFFIYICKSKEEINIEINEIISAKQNIKNNNIVNNYNVNKKIFKKKKKGKKKKKSKKKKGNKNIELNIY